MAKEFVNPNLHVVLIHFPLGLLFAGVLIELFSFLGWRRSAFHAAGRWMILLGTLTAIPAALSGVYALSDVSRRGMSAADASMHWKDLSARSPLVRDAEAWQHISDHALYEAIATGVLVLIVLIWLGSSDRWRSRLYWPLLIGLLIGTAMVSAAAWNGGEGVYRHGIGVETSPEREPASITSTAMTAAARQATEPATEPAASPSTTPAPAPAAPATPAPATPPAATPAPSPSTAAPSTPAPSTPAPSAPSADRPAAPAAQPTPPRRAATHDEESSASEQQHAAARGIEYFLPPMQVHVILAGLAIALAVSALGLAFRQANAEAGSDSIDAVAAALAPRAEADEDPFLPAEQRRSIAESTAAAARRHTGIPPARFWLLASLLTLATAAVGYYLLAGPGGINNYQPRAIWEEISAADVKNPGARFPVTRQLAHVVAGSSIFVLMLLLALLGRFAPRQRVLLTLLSLLLIALVAAQIWLGIVLMYDTPAGPVTSFS